MAQPNTQRIASRSFFPAPDATPTLSAIPENHIPESFWARRGGEIAGKGYFVANLYWIAMGLLSLSPREVIAGTVNLMGSLCRARLNRATVEGIEEFGTKGGAVAGLLAQLITSAPAVLRGDGFVILADGIITIAQASDYFSKEIRLQSMGSKNPVSRMIGSNLRAIGGILRLTTRIPMIAMNMDHPLIVSVFVVLGLMDIVSALSRPAMNASQVTRVIRSPALAFIKHSAAQALALLRAGQPVTAHAMDRITTRRIAKVSGEMGRILEGLRAMQELPEHSRENDSRYARALAQLAEQSPSPRPRHRHGRIKTRGKLTP